MTITHTFTQNPKFLKSTSRPAKHYTIPRSSVQLTLQQTLPAESKTTQILLRVKARTSPCISRIIKSRRMSWVGYIACMGEKRKAYKQENLKRLLTRPTHRWKDNIKNGC
jgi:hypothetical protein